MIAAAKALKFIWDEPPKCTTPRGWAYLSVASHPDRGARGWDYHKDNGALCCGNYLQYQSTTGPAGETFHACAYLHRVTEAGVRSDRSLGWAWFWTAADAKGWIERAVTLALETEHAR